MKRLATGLWFVAAAAMGACMDAPVTWDEPSAAVPVTEGSRLAVDPNGTVRVQAPPRPPRTLPTDGGLCATSFRIAWDGAVVHATWWSVRHDSSAALYAALSADSGATWTALAIVDSTDRGDVGCTRPAPSIAANDGNTYIVYAMRAPEGTGVFLSHSMAADKMPAMFHSAVTVIYGDRLVPVSVAVDGDAVAVAYEDPSGKAPRIDLALSTTQGHNFESRSIASSEPVSAAIPDVALARPLVAVSWFGAEGGRMTRVGRMR